MGRKKGKGGGTKTPKTSSGIRWYSRKGKQILRLKMKIARWERNQLNEMKKKAGESRNNWDTAGLKRHLKLLEELISQGPKRRR
jgi:hypothetical protein